MNLTPCLFLDRDGIIIKDKNYLSQVSDIVLKKDIIPIIKLAKRRKMKVISITNQSGIARGYFSFEDVNRVNDEINKQLEHVGAQIDHWYICPHHEDGINEYALKCTCRKPSSDLFLRAKKDYHLSFSESYMIGDKNSDRPQIKEIKTFLVQGKYDLFDDDTAQFFDNLSLLYKYLLDLWKSDMN